MRQGASDYCIFRRACHELMAEAAATAELAGLLGDSVRQGASDLHLSAGMPPLVRVDGDIRPLVPTALEPDAVRQLVCAGMTARQREDYATRLETDYSFALPGLGRFRVNAFTQQRGAAAVFRTIPVQVPTMAELGMGEVFHQLAELSRGLVLVTGPTGSGKSTTLAALLDHINSSHCQHILTIEDPIEFIHQSKRCLVNQREVGRDTHSFDAALRAGLREDPDVILVGELRDLTTIRLALTAAETGHLVLATLHTASAAKTIDRIVGVFPAAEKNQVRAMLAESLQAVVAQTLLKKADGGRVAAREIMLATPAIRNLIREDKVAQMQSAIQTGAALGMQTLEQSLQQLRAQGLVVAGD